MSLDRLTFAVAIFVVAGALCAGCGKDSASGGAASTGSDQVAPGVTPSQSEIDRIKAQRMPPLTWQTNDPACRVVRVAVAHLTVHQAVVQHTSRVVTNYLSSIAHSD